MVKSDPIPTPSGSVTTSPAQVVTLSTGNALVLSGTQLYLWDSATAVTTPLNPQGLNVVSLVRSADRTVVLLQGTSGGTTGAAIYDAPSGTFGATIQGLGIGYEQPAAALNPNGSQIAFITPGGSDDTGFLDFYDGQFNLINSQPLYNQDSVGQLIYGLDGSALYAFFWQPGAGDVGVAYSATTFAPEGLFSMYAQGGPIAAVPYAIDETGDDFWTGGRRALWEPGVHQRQVIPRHDSSSSLQTQNSLSRGDCPKLGTTIAGIHFPRLQS